MMVRVATFNLNNLFSVSISKERSVPFLEKERVALR